MSMPEIEKSDYRGNVNIGLYALVTENYGLFPPEFKKKELFEVEEKLEVAIAKTNLIGLFCAGNSNGLILPSIVKESELAKLEDKNYTLIDSELTALGNLILCNDRGAIISPHLKKYQRKIEETLGVKTTVGTLNDLTIVGSCGVATNQGALLHRDSGDQEIEQVESRLQVEADIGTVNFGSPYVGTGILANSHHILVGNETKGPELGRIYTALGS